MRSGPSERMIGGPNTDLRRLDLRPLGGFHEQQDKVHLLHLAHRNSHRLQTGLDPRGEQLALSLGWGPCFL